MNTVSAQPSKKEVLSEWGHLWPDGWYLYGKGEITGPYEVGEVLQLVEQDREHGKNCLLSRKGFSCWYDYQTLSQLYSEQNLEQKDAFSAPTKVPTMEAAPLARPRESEKKLIPQAQGKKLGPGPAASSQAKLTSLAIVQELPQDSPFSSPLRAGVAIELARQQADKSLTPTAKSFDYYHMVTRGRLRIGKMANPWVLALVKFPLTGGLVWKNWYEQALIETTYHLDDPYAPQRLAALWQAMLPGLHLVMIYRLAKLILQMEVQNHYKSTSPTIAFFCALCPPLAMFYLQSALNKHWYLHVGHAVKSKQID